MVCQRANHRLARFFDNPISEQEYLTTAYQPVCEFGDGALIQRHAGTEKHSWLQTAIGTYIFRRRRQWNINVYVEQRNRVRAGKYKISALRGRWSASGHPDISVPPAASHRDSVAGRPPRAF
jgi:hypothetical protein